MCGRAWRRGRVRAAALAAALLVALVLRMPAHLSAEHAFPARTPAQLAHSLADFSNHPYVESWAVEEDHSNYTTWRYSVSFKCGARCRGRAGVLAHDEPRAGAAPRHGHAARLHRVALDSHSCTTLPLLPWPQYCEELGIAAVVSASGGEGALLRAEARTRCSALGWLSGACARWLRAQLDLRVQLLHRAAPVSR